MFYLPRIVWKTSFFFTFHFFVYKQKHADSISLLAWMVGHNIAPLTFRDSFASTPLRGRSVEEVVWLFKRYKIMISFIGVVCAAYAERFLGNINNCWNLNSMCVVFPKEVVWPRIIEFNSTYYYSPIIFTAFFLMGR